MPKSGGSKYASYSDFFVVMQEVGGSLWKSLWNFSWFDASGDNVIQSGRLSKPETLEKPYVIDAVFAANNKILIVNGRGDGRGRGVESEPFEFLVAIDLTRSTKLRVIWENRRKIDVSMSPFKGNQSQFYAVVVVNSKIYQKEESLDGSSRIDTLSAETGQTLSTLMLNLGGLLLEIQGPEPEGRELMEPVEWIAVRTRETDNSLTTEQIQILNLETSEVRTIYLTIENEDWFDLGMIFFKDFLYIEEYRPDDEERGLILKWFQIPTGELLYHVDNDYEFGFSFDLGKEVLHLFKHHSDADDKIKTTILTFNPCDKTPKFTELQSAAFPVRTTCYSLFVTLGIECGGNDLTLTVEPFGKGQSRKRILGVNKYRGRPGLFVTRSRAILFVEREDSKELFLLDFAI